MPESGSRENREREEIAGLAILRAVGSTPDRVDSVRRVRANLARVGPEWVRSDGDFARVALPDDDADALRDLLLEEKAAVVVEIGLAYGVSALAIAEALVAHSSRPARHLIIDPFQGHFHDVGWRAIERAGLTDVCSLLRERSQLALPRILADGLVADAAFVDGSHLFHNVFVDLFYLGEIVRPGGLVVLDDGDRRSIATAARYFELNLGWQPQSLGARTRLSAYRLPNPRVEPSFESFQPFGDDAGD